MVYQEIKELIETGRLVTEMDESRIQPSSFEPRISDELFIIDTETEGVFRPQDHETIYRTLLQLPRRQRQKVDISDGFEVKKGFTYLVPLEERLSLIDGEKVKSSPKSTTGRHFLYSRLLTDHNPCFDEILSGYGTQRELAMWLLIQPLAFNLILRPGLSLNQLRFFTGHAGELFPDEIAEEFDKNPFLFRKGMDGKLSPARPTITTEGIQLHLDLLGRYTEGIVGLRARNNPEPIDLSIKGAYNAEDFFEPLVANGGKLTIPNSEHYLLSSAEVLRIPPHLNAELAAHSHVGISGPIHFAGFIDNGFGWSKDGIGDSGSDLVYEVRSHELSNMVLEDGMPISRLTICRTALPDKIYGEGIGSSYQGQVGPKPPKQFMTFDYAYAARNYGKLDKTVLVQDSMVLQALRKERAGLEYIAENRTGDLLKAVRQGFFHSRYDCESDTSVMQIIPYVILFDESDNIFAYVRASDVQDYGEDRLFGKHSIGLGGHILKTDGPDFLRRCLIREVMEEEAHLEDGFSEPKLIGTLTADDTPVDKVHFGVIYAIESYGSVAPKDSSVISGRMVSIDYLKEDIKNKGKYETWSSLLIPELEDIIAISRRY